MQAAEGRGHQEGEEEATVADDGSGKGDHGADEEEAGKGEAQAAKNEGSGRG